VVATGRCRAGGERRWGGKDARAVRRFFSLGLFANHHHRRCLCLVTAGLLYNIYILLYNNIIEVTAAVADTEQQQQQLSPLLASPLYTHRCLVLKTLLARASIRHVVMYKYIHKRSTDRRRRCTYEKQRNREYTRATKAGGEGESSESGCRCERGGRGVDGSRG